MNRYGNLYDKIISIDNLLLADKKARRGKSKQPGVIEHNKNRYINILKLHKLLLNEKYITSEYTIFKIYEPKEREIFRLPYIDRIVHHAIMNVLEPIFVSTYTANTYSCVKGRGIHLCKQRVEKVLLDKENTKYVLKLDIKKFYPNIDHNILKSLLEKKFKDKKLLKLLFDIIDTAPGAPIGNLLSQFLANFYLTYFDHWLKEELKIKYVFRYCDDICIFSNNKEGLHILLVKIKEYLKVNLKLDVKSNHQIFPLEDRGLDFVGYKFYNTHTLIRKSIKKRFIKMIKYNNNYKSKASYYGWLIHANTINLRNKYYDKN